MSVSTPLCFHPPPTITTNTTNNDRRQTLSGYLPFHGRSKSTPSPLTTTDFPPSSAHMTRTRYTAAAASHIGCCSTRHCRCSPLQTQETSQSQNHAAASSLPSRFHTTFSAQMVVRVLPYTAWNTMLEGDTDFHLPCKHGARAGCRRRQQPRRPQGRGSRARSR